ncbi:arsenic metallochaperone ArsD family protein [Methanorbis furvi]|uniref:DUF2703 domain-containing protein n=1 Tax=Methanorbis furvi TaxID=3028299 RepID=A0AAE4SAE2_9EURY|nr:hypothetical protein [Methanocorpusculaceae archaeon Ag1]
MVKQLIIDFLYLDLNTCDRCMDTNSALDEALAELSGVLNTLGYQVSVNAVNIATREQARQYHFLSSPTIRVNGLDIFGVVTENSCCSCGEICSDTVDCRTFTYEGMTYDQPPKAMIIDCILRALYGTTPHPKAPYTLPENLERFFVGKNAKTSSTKKDLPNKTIQIFASPACCSTDCCCSGTDSEERRISATLGTLLRHGIIIERCNFNSIPVSGKEPFTPPVTVLDGSVVLSGRYPTDAEIVQWLGLPADLLEKLKKGGCC